jgi:hypothetical protein
MRREDFDALIEAVASTAEVTQVIVVGSQSILASIDESELPRQVTLSPEIDVVIAEHPRAGAVRRLLGPGSLLDSQRGVYVDVVSEATPQLPTRWRARAIEHHPAAMPWVVAVCPEVHDLALAKIGAGRRDKDLAYVEALLACAPPLLDLDVLEARLPEMSGVIPVDEIDRVRAWLARARQRQPR